MSLTEIREWSYPDTLDKQIMNDLIRNNKLSAKKYTNPNLDIDIAASVAEVLNDFDVWGYTTSQLVLDPSDGTYYKEHTVTSFFNLMMTEFKLMQAEEEKAKLDLWNAQQAELPPDERFNPNA